MLEADTLDQLAIARAGDEDAFRHLTDPYRHELLVLRIGLKASHFHWGKSGSLLYFACR
jgi:hypothetical protein